MKIAVLGSGSWGTALAKVLVENHHDVTIWGNNSASIDAINQIHQNPHYLPNTMLPAKLQATLDLTQALTEVEMVLLVLPTIAMRSVLTQLKETLHVAASKPLIVHATKGLELKTHLRISEIIQEVMPRELYSEIVVLSGPSHAEEVAQQDLTTITAASESIEAAQTVQTVFMNDYFRVYTNTDVIGVELGAALKNIIALGAGVLAGAGYGDNSKAALLTRGLAEISRLGIKMGADPLTFIGLSGVGDLVVTCTSPHSRNWQAGRLLAKGKTRQEIEDAIQMVVEGVTTCHSAYELSKTLDVDMPITDALYEMLYVDENIDLAAKLKKLMMREGKSEASSLSPGC